MAIADIINSPEKEGKEKHVPVISVDGDVITVKVGDEVAHPNTPAHHIAWVSLYGVTKDKGMVLNLGRAEFAPGHTEPVASFKVLEPGSVKTLYAVAYCNIHGIWESTLDV